MVQQQLIAEITPAIVMQETYYMSIAQWPGALDLESVPGPDEPSGTEGGELAIPHEFTLWSNGHLTIEHWLYQFDGAATRDHACLDRRAVQALRDFLNGPQITAFLEE